MAPAAQLMTEEEFSRIAAECSRWSDRSIGVARALLVDGVPLSDAATTHDMSKQQANVVRARFVDKAEKKRISEFMAREKPKMTLALLEPYSQHMKTLRDKGYTFQQIVSFLAENGIETSVTTVRNFLKE